MQYIITNALLVLETGTKKQGWLVVRDGRIDRMGEGRVPDELSSLTQTDAQGCALCPGFIDLHTHGCGGHDFMDGTAEAIVGAARAHLRHGTTLVAPTTLTCTDEELFRFFEQYADAERETENMPRLAGIHLEGPYFSPVQAGAQPPESLRVPEKKHYDEILKKAGDKLLRWSLAPELPGAMALGDELKECGVLVSIGHSNADYETVKESLKHGFSHVTHFYSCLSTITRRMGSRMLGVIECAYLFDELNVELIADGKHLPPELLRLILKQKPHKKISLVTDSMRGAGMPEGPSILGSLAHGTEVEIKDGIAYMPDHSAFAGSVATTDRLVRTMVTQAGLPLHEAVNMASLHPARLIGRENEVGSLKPGKRADLVLLDKDLYTQRVFIAGKPVF